MPFHHREHIFDQDDIVGSTYAFKWLSKRFMEERLGTGKALATNPNEGGRNEVLSTWEEIEREWSEELKSDNVNSSMIDGLNAWIDRFFPSGTNAAGKERQRLLSNIRVERSRREKKGIMLTVNFVDLDGKIKKSVKSNRLFYVIGSDRWMSFQRAFVRACVEDVLSDDCDRQDHVVKVAIDRIENSKQKDR